VIVYVPVETRSETNQREHWGARHRRRKMQRTATYYELLAFEPLRPDPPVVVTLTRISPRKLDDDNLRAALKACRDGVADWLGIDDGDERIEWRYGQEKGAPREKAVRVEIEAKEARNG